MRWTEEDTNELIELVKLLGKSDGVKTFKQLHIDRSEDSIRSKLRVVLTDDETIVLNEDVPEKIKHDCKMFNFYANTVSYKEPEFKKIYCNKPVVEPWSIIPGKKHKSIYTKILSWFRRKF